MKVFTRVALAVILALGVAGIAEARGRCGSCRGGGGGGRLFQGRFFQHRHQGQTSHCSTCSSGTVVTNTEVVNTNSNEVIPAPQERSATNVQYVLVTDNRGHSFYVRASDLNSCPGGFCFR